jgi:hypothetical protein
MRCRDRRAGGRKWARRGVWQGSGPHVRWTKPLRRAQRPSEHVARLCDIGLALARIVGQQGPAHDLGRRVALSAASRQQSHIPGSRPSFECREREARGSTRSGVILRGLSEASLRLCEALSCACLERYRSVLAKHQAEMLERTLRRSFGAQPAALASGSDIRATIADQIEALKTAIKESQSNSNVLSELGGPRQRGRSEYLADADDGGP